VARHSRCQAGGTSSCSLPGSTRVASRHDSALSGKPLVSVLMPIRNGERYLAEAVESVIGQTLQDWELVAVLDGCTDNSEAVVRGFADARIRVLSLPESAGFPRALNKGLGQCRGDLVARFDQDDVCMPTRLERQVSVLNERAELAVIGSAAEIIDESSRIVGFLAVRTGVRRLRLGLLLRNQLIHPSVMFRRSIVVELGGYDPQASPIFEDYDLWLRMLTRGDIDNLREPLISYRRHAGQQSRGSTLSRRAMRTVSESRRRAALQGGVPLMAVKAMEFAWLIGQIRHEVVVARRRGSTRS
jgi:glycosyltransferase involved in cell wall biosynthesis